MRTVAEEVFELVWSLGGTISGEHGDGVARSEFVRRQYPSLYPIFQKLRSIFDPDSVMNPGRIVNATPGLTDNLRYDVSSRESALSIPVRFLSEVRNATVGELVEALSALTLCAPFSKPSVPK